MALAHGTVKHFGLHRLDHVELRVVADDEDGILRVEQAEIDAVGRLSGDARWQHKTVTLFVLADLQPLQRQLESLRRVPADVRLQQKDELLSRPVVNVYDLASPATCNVFVNRKAMMAAKYWDDVLALQGLLAHEHAHPLAECRVYRHPAPAAHCGATAAADALVGRPGPGCELGPAQRPAARRTSGQALLGRAARSVYKRDRRGGSIPRRPARHSKSYAEPASATRSSRGASSPAQRARRLSGTHSAGTGRSPALPHAPPPARTRSSSPATRTCPD